MLLQKGTAHSACLQNRDQRLFEYTDRHYALTCTRQARKRRRVLYTATRPDHEDVLTDVEAADAKICSSRTIVLGGRVGWSHVG